MRVAIGCECERLREKRLSGERAGNNSAILAWFGTVLGGAERLDL